MRFYLPLLAALLLAGTAGCSAATYDERVGYLQLTASRGVQTHDLLVAQATPRIDAQRCTDAFAALNDHDAPTDGGGTVSQPWSSQIQAFFVDSCVSGLPRPVGPQDAPGTSAATPPAPAAPTP